MADPKVRRWITDRVKSARFRAKQEGVPFNITKKHIASLWTGVCPALGVVLSPGGSPTCDSPSLDRIIPELGYTIGNVAILSLRANAIKQDATLTELQKVCKWLHNYWRTKQ